MTDKELRKLKRSELIEILYYLHQENDELREKNRKLEERFDILLKETVSGKNEGSVQINKGNTKRSDGKKRRRK